MLWHDQVGNDYPQGGWIRKRISVPKSENYDAVVKISFSNSTTGESTTLDIIFDGVTSNEIDPSKTVVEISEWNGTWDDTP